MMEEKESTVSASMSDSGSESPSPVTSFAVAAGETTMEADLFNVDVSMKMNAPEVGIVMTPFPSTMTSPGVENNTASSVVEIAAKGSDTGGDTSGKRKRGRPRKYDSAGNVIVRSSPATAKKSKGKASHPGNGNFHASFDEVSGTETTVGEDFRPHTITVNIGEDIAAKIMGVAEKGERGMCVLSANGAVSNVTIRQSASSSGGFLTYEGRFEIITVSGSYVGRSEKTGGWLSVSVAGSDGRVVGGALAGPLIAATPIQVVAGSFMMGSKKAKKRKYERKSGLPIGTPNAVGAASASASGGEATKSKGEEERKKGEETCLDVDPTNGLQVTGPSD